MYRRIEPSDARLLPDDSIPYLRVIRGQFMRQLVTCFRLPFAIFDVILLFLQMTFTVAPSASLIAVTWPSICKE